VINFQAIGQSLGWIDQLQATYKNAKNLSEHIGDPEFISSMEDHFAAIFLHSEELRVMMIKRIMSSSLPAPIAQVDRAEVS
jgi:hypothetical protein